MMKRYLIGFGNYSQGDDGIGLRIIERVVEKGLDTNFEAVELRNDGLALLTYFNTEVISILIVDCARMGIVPGDFKIFSPDDVSTKKMTAGISTHEGDVLKLIEFAKNLQIPLPNLKIMAVEPALIEPEMKLSPTLEKRLDEYVSHAVQTIINMPLNTDA